MQNAIKYKNDMTEKEKKKKKKSFLMSVTWKRKIEQQIPDCNFY